VAQVQAEDRDGTRFPISISFSVAEINNELLFTAIMRDLTAERDLAMQVKRAERLAAVGQMVATVSHEIRTPLTLIGGFAGQLLKERGLSERGKRKMSIIVEEVARLEKMLSELNDLSRVQPYEWEELDADEIVDHVKALMGPQFKRDRFFFRLHKKKGLPKVVADRNRLSQVLINLVNNAAQASVPGDEIIMELTAGPEGGVEIRVRDYGTGIPAKHMAEIFHPFFTTKKRGTGLGLPLAKRIVEEHGGKIELHSDVGSGTVAKVQLPASPELAAGSEPIPLAQTEKGIDQSGS
jgi:signal transduction histidine kinase